MYDTSQWVKEYDPKGKIKEIIRNSNCRLEYVDSISLDAINNAGDAFKTHIKKNMSYAMGEAMLNKIKFTATEDLHTMTKKVRAHVYVFTDEEIMKLVEDIIDAG